jgi:acyl-CoA reductase-like NAD-dependent aldehyde dehydrogenase
MGMNYNWEYMYVCILESESSCDKRKMLRDENQGLIYSAQGVITEPTGQSAGIHPSNFPSLQPGRKTVESLLVMDH